MKTQRGIALIIALLLVAIGALVAAGLIDQTELSIARTRNQLREQQAYAYARGLEVWAVDLLRRDSATGTTDSNRDSWAQGLPPMDVPGGKLSGGMRDQNGCINLNALVKNGQPQPVMQKRLDRLLSVLKINPSLTESIIDWIDADSTPMPGGAETLNYLLLDPPYRAANRQMLHISELRLVRGVDAKTYARLAPHVCATPRNSPLNINTASVEVLMALADNMSEATARRIHAEGQANFASVAAFTQMLAQQGLEVDAEVDAQALLAVHSTYFLAESMMKLDAIPLNYFSVIERSAGGIRIVARSRGVY